MAEVYLAHDDVLDRDVALKVMNDRYAHDEEFVERFKREAQSAAALSHPNIVAIYDRGETEDSPRTYYIAMEYLPGGTLKDRLLKRGPLPARTAAAVALQIAEALRAAHDRGVVHRDIKPQNILITDSGNLKVTDFGIARAASSSTMTRTGSILGTAQYISPEQAMGEPVGPGSDQYSLGVVLYEMLTGLVPYEAETSIGVAMKHVNSRPIPPSERDPSIPPSMDAVTLRLLAKDPDERYADDTELIEDLERLSEGLEPSDQTTEVLTRVIPPAATRASAAPATRPRTRPPAGTPGAKTSKRRGLLPVFLVLAVLAVLAALGWAGYNALQGSGSSGAQQVQVPDLSGMTLDEARDRYGEDFRFTESSRQDSAEPVGTVLSQDPQPGGVADRNSGISAVVSGGQPVPDVTGQSRAAAERTLSEAGFRPQVDTRESTADREGLVVDQSPASGQRADSGSEVGITVGSGPAVITVPDLTGLDAGRAGSVLREAGLSFGSVERAPSGAVSEGQVFSQNPSANTSVAPDTSINVTISSGPRQISVPSVVGSNVEAAKRSLLDAGLGYTIVERQSGQSAGTVVATEPGAGTPVAPSTRVTLIESSGPPSSGQSPQPGGQPAGPGSGSSPTPQPGASGSGRQNTPAPSPSGASSGSNSNGSNSGQNGSGDNSDDSGGGADN